MEKGTEQIQTTSKTFTAINVLVTKMVKDIMITSENLSDTATNSQQMIESVEEITAITKQSDAGVEQTSAASQQTSSSMEEVAESSIQLAGLAEELDSLVNQFKL